MTEKQYAKLLNEISAGPIPKNLLFEIVERDGHRFLFNLKDSVGKWYPTSESVDPSKRGYVQVLDGRAVAHLSSDEVAILTPRKSFIGRTGESFKRLLRKPKGPHNEIDLGTETGSP